MADVRDIEDLLSGLVNTAVQPLVGTTYTPSRAVDVARYGTIPIATIQVSPGDPFLRYMTTRLEAGKILIGISSESTEHHLEQSITRNLVAPSAGVASAKLTVTTVGNKCTIGGIIQAGDVVGVTVQSLGASYTVLGTDTINSVATALAAAATAAGITASASGAVVTIAGVATPSFAVGTQLAYGDATWRRLKTFHATIWSTMPFDLSVVGKTVESLFVPSQRLPLNDGSSADILEMDSFDLIDQQRDGAFVRRVRWKIYFVTILPITSTQVVATDQSLLSTPLTLATSGLIPSQYVNAPTATQL